MDKRFKKIEDILRNNSIPRKNVLRDKEWSFKYVKYRILRPVLKLKYSAFRKKIDSSPWLSPASILFFEDYLSKDLTGCEFGSGGSTTFFASRVKSFVSIEHNKEWYHMVNERLKKQDLQSVVDYRLIEQQEPNSTKSSSDVFPTIKGMDQYDYRKDYVNYFNALSDFEDGTFDFIIVDGRARPECVFASIAKLKSNGLMILDNSERTRYDIVFDNLKDWEMINTTNGLTNTTLWIKP
jgi:hypothetical protein